MSTLKTASIKRQPSKMISCLSFSSTASSFRSHSSADFSKPYRYAAGDSYIRQSIRSDSLMATRHKQRLTSTSNLKSQSQSNIAPRMSAAVPNARPVAPPKWTSENSTQAPTQATTFRLEQKPKAPSRIISTSTKFDASGIDLPPPPPMPPGRATHFECPYCSVLVPIGKRESRLWKQHLIDDLQPFICIEPECPTPDLAFETKNDWIEHQRWEHAIEWWCEGDDAEHAPLKFCTEEDFTSHLLASHRTNLSRSTLRSRVEMAGTSIIDCIQLLSVLRFPSRGLRFSGPKQK